MAVYMIIEITIKEKQLYARYVNQVHSIVTQHGGKYLARGGHITPISGDWHPERMIIIEFQDKRQMEQCFQSPEYLEIAPLREDSTITKAIAIEGHQE